MVNKKGKGPWGELWFFPLLLAGMYLVGLLVYSLYNEFWPGEATVTVCSKQTNGYVSTNGGRKVLVDNPQEYAKLTEGNKYKITFRGNFYEKQENNVKIKEDLGVAGLYGCVGRGYGRYK